MSKVVVFGTGSFAEVVHFYLTHDSPHEVAAFTAHEKYIAEETMLDLPVVPFGSLEEKYPPEKYDAFAAVGYRDLNSVRADICDQFRSKGYDLITYINSACTHWGDTEIGDNCFIFEDNTIQPFVKIGDNVVLWSGNHIGHHVTIGDHCFITSHVVISGHVNVKPYTFIGVNSTIRDGIDIGERCVIGAGSIIMAPTRDREVYIPARTRPDERTSDEINL